MRSHSPLSRRLLVVDLVIPVIGFHMGTLVRRALPYYGEVLSPVSSHPPFLVYALVLASWTTALIVTGVYQPERVLCWYQESMRVVAASMMATMLIAGALYLTTTELSRLQFGYALIINLGLLLGVRSAMRAWHRLIGHRNPQASIRVLLVGAGELGARAASVLDDYRRWGYEQVGFVDDGGSASILSSVNLGSIDHMERIILDQRVNDVWIALPAELHYRVRDVVQRLSTLPVRVHIVPDCFALAMVSAKPRNFGGLPVIALRDPVITGASRVLKRAFDIGASFVLLTLTAPVMAVLAALIRLDSRGPAVFGQLRVGENGQLFRMFKFRTMVADAELIDEHLKSGIDLRAIDHKRRVDARVTRMGRVLRRYSLDELPQLFNVLRGNMSMVGPRPELPWLVAKYDPWQRRRLAVPQGMTGWWQISGRSDKPMHLHTDEDLYYVYNYSLWLDLRILAKTFGVLMHGNGAF